MTDEITTILDAYHASTLSEMAEAAGLEVARNGKKLRKAELLAEMRAKYFTKERVLASLARLSERERAVLNRLLLRGGTALTRSFQREIVRAGLALLAEEPKKSQPYYYRSGVPYAQGYSGSPERSHSKIFEDIIARLTYHGLVFSRDVISTIGNTTYKLQFHPAATLYIPQAIQKYLPKPEPIPVTIPDRQPAQVQSGDPMLLLRDLYLYWDFVRRNEVTLLQSGVVGRRWLKALNELLLMPDPLLEQARREDETGHLYLLRQVLEALKLVCSEQGRLRPTGKDALHLPSFWSQSLMAQLNACLEVWPKLRGLQDLGQAAISYGPNYPHARQTVLNVLKTLSSSQVWLELDEFLERIRAKDPDFLLPEHTRLENYRGSWYSSYSSGYYYGDTQVLLQTFEKLEAEFVSHCLTGFLYQLGLIELGYDSAQSTSPSSTPGNGNPWRVFRLTPTGRMLLGPASPEQPAEGDTGRLVVQPNFQLIAIGPVSLAILAKLDLFADREQVDRGAFQYRLSRESVYRAQQLGLVAAEVTRFLTETSGMELPQNVRRSLEEWATHHERIVFRTGVSLLQTAQADMLAKLLDEPDMAKFLARPLTPEVALIKQGQQEELVSTLIAQGLFPAISGAQPEAADKSVIIQANGLIQPIHAVPSLHLRGRLARLAEEINGEGWRLTPASVQQAGGSRNKILGLLEELGKLHRGPLPDQLVEQVKAWGNYYGDAAVETLTLIEFHTQTTLDELQVHPRLREYLTPFSAGNRALAVVPTDKVAELKEILAGFGIRIKADLRR